MPIAKMCEYMSKKKMEHGIYIDLSEFSYILSFAKNNFIIISVLARIPETTTLVILGGVFGLVAAVCCTACQWGPYLLEASI